MSENHDDCSVATRADIVAVTLSSLLIISYLLYAHFNPRPAFCGQESEMARQGIVELQVESESTDGLVVDLSGYAEYVKPGSKDPSPVPDSALYPYDDDPAKQAPPPPHEAKEQSWHNKILFPSVKCPYCGRRVPTKKGSYLWLIVGFIGQFGFSMRFLVQWIASEKAKASVIPVSFWYLSIIGSILLLMYAVSIVAWPIILGQTPNVFIYARNLYLIRKRERTLRQD